MSPRKLARATLLLTLLSVAGLVYVTDLTAYLSLDGLKQHRTSLADWNTESPVLFSLYFSLVYISVTALSIPGAAVLTLAAGALFGVVHGTVLVSISSTIGATLAFLGSRYVFRDLALAKFRDRMRVIDEGLKKEGSFYLFTLRLVPAFPFFLVNLLMGLTSFSGVRFFIVSQLGMLPGTIVYVNAGTELSKLESVSGILNPTLLISFTILGLLPLLSQKVIGYYRSQRHLRRYPRPKKFDYNMVVIGGGSAGLVTAYIGAAVKARVALIEKNKMGGDCLNTGCVPSKTLIRSAKIFSYMKRSKEFGLICDSPRVNFQEVMKRVKSVIKEIEPHDSIERYTKLGVECITGSARISSPFEVEVNGRSLKTKNIVIATGAGPFVPKLPGLDLVVPLTSENVWDLAELPKRLLVLGGGPIGCELAQAFARLGSTVALIEMSDRIMQREDPDVSAIVQRRMQDEGVKFFTSHRALRIEKSKDGFEMFCDRSGQETSIAFDQVLFAIGRKANTQGFGAEELGLEISETGTFAADRLLSTTNYPNIFVCGDVAGPYQFTHTASHQAWYAAVNALFRPFKTFKVDYRVIPWCTFTDPEVARVGLNESEARALGVDYEVTKYGIDDLDRAITENEAHGFVKVLTKTGSDRILGVTIVGHRAGDIIAEFVTAMKHGIGLNKILGTIHIYPTFSEANKYAAGVWKRQHAPDGMLKLLSRFHSWRRG